MAMISNNAFIAMSVAFALPILAPGLSIGAENNANILHDEPIRPLPVPENLNLAKLQLGEQLFQDNRLSLNNKLACSTCHQLSSGGDDNLKLGIAHSNSNEDPNQHTINTPSVFNSRYNFRQNWDGRFKSFDDTLDHIVHSHMEANTSWAELIDELKQDQNLSREFKSVYSEGLSRATFIDALKEYLNSLVTVNAPFDKYLKGDDKAISKEEKRGYQLFKDLGCISCHQGINVGGNLFQKFGIFYDYFGARGNITNADYGRMNITGRQVDRHVFKVPSLRNVAVTAPYLHDGNAKTLDEAVVIMAKTQLGINISKKETSLIVKFLKTLTGEYKGVPLNGGTS